MSSGQSRVQTRTRTRTRLRACLRGGAAGCPGARGRAPAAAARCPAPPAATCASAGHGTDRRTRVCVVLLSGTLSRPASGDLRAGRPCRLGPTDGEDTCAVFTIALERDIQISLSLTLSAERERSSRTDCLALSSPSRRRAGGRYKGGDGGEGGRRREEEREKKRVRRDGGRERDTVRGSESETRRARARARATD